MKDSFGILCVGLSPAIQKTLLFEDFTVGEVNRSRTYYTDAAGKCVNTCKVLVQGGADTACLTVAGRENKAEFEKLCARDSIPLTAVETAGRVRICSTIVEESKNRCTELVAGEPELISTDEETAFREKFIELLPGCRDAVIISGSRLAGFSDEIIPFMVKKVKERNLLLFADYRGRDLSESFISETIRPDYIKINEHEFVETFGDSGGLEKSMVGVSEKYHTAFIVTRGPEGTLTAENGKLFETASDKLKAVNTIGCGDSMTAGIAQAVTEGLSLEAAVDRGREYASRNAMSIHPGWIKEELDD